MIMLCSETKMIGRITVSKWQIPYPQEVKVAGYMDSEEPIYFQNMTMKQSEERLKKNDVLILPIGSTECHGAHACYGEDTFLVTRMAEQVAKKTGCTVSQPIWFGSHPYHHMGMSGTIPINENTTQRRTFNSIPNWRRSGRIRL